MAVGVTVPKQARQSATAVDPNELDAADKAALAAYAARQAERPAARAKVTQSNAGSSINPDHPDPAFGWLTLMSTFGTASPEFAESLLKQLAKAASQGPDADEAGINFMLSVINGIQPRDEIEALLGAQMAAVHLATMTFARRLAHVENIPQQDAAERAFNKLARTFTTQVEALKRYRSDGKQVVRVERVTVEAGGQAIVGSVDASRGGGGGSR